MDPPTYPFEETSFMDGPLLTRIKIRTISYLDIFQLLCFNFYKIQTSHYIFALKTYNLVQNINLLFTSKKVENLEHSKVHIA